MSGQPTRVTFVTDRLVFGGAERHAITVADALDRRRFAVAFATLKPGGPLEALVDRSAYTHFETADVGRKLDFDAVRRLAGHFEASAAEVVVAANPYATLYSLLAARRLRRRPAVLSTFHSTVMSTPKDKLQMVFYRGVFPFCDRLVYVSENQRRYWRRRGLRARADLTIHNGIDTAHFSAQATGADVAAVRRACGFAPGDFVVGICAALRPEKAHGDLLQAIGRLQRAGRRVRTLIIGDGPERQSIEAGIASLGIGADVHITGYQMDVRPFILASDVMVLPSHSETFSLSALESMALGKPMVMTRTGGASEQVDDGRTGLLYEPGDVARLAAHLEALAASGDAAAMGERAAQYVTTRFPVGKMIDEYAELIASQAATARRRRG